jgi:two-component system, NtrC family, response regulator GlrR
MVGRSRAFLEFTALLKKIAQFDVPVLIEGETGTGKELAARAIHYNSRRRTGPFVPVNCGAIPDTLFESELFGHRRGAFTGASDDQPGLVGLADQGTLLLDEVDSLSLKGQVSLLRFLQDQQYRPLGARSLRQGDVRIIAASNRNLDDLAASTAFREDLFYRLKLMHVRVPPLRKRHGDAAFLAAHFLDLAVTRFELRPRRLAPESLRWFDRYHWPGNVRELEYLIYRAVLLTEDADVCVEPPAALAECAHIADADPIGEDLTYREAKARAIDTFERTFLTMVMARANGSVSTAARLVRTERRHLSRLLKRYGIGKTHKMA